MGRVIASDSEDVEEPPSILNIALIDDGEEAGGGMTQSHSQATIPYGESQHSEIFDFEYEDTFDSDDD